MTRCNADRRTTARAPQHLYAAYFAFCSMAQMMAHYSQTRASESEPEYGRAPQGTEGYIKSILVELPNPDVLSQWHVDERDHVPIRSQLSLRGGTGSKAPVGSGLTTPSDRLTSKTQDVDKAQLSPLQLLDKRWFEEEKEKISQAWPTDLPSSDPVRRLFILYDRNSDGVIDSGEFIQLVGDLLCLSLRDLNIDTGKATNVARVFASEGFLSLKTTPHISLGDVLTFSNHWADLLVENKAVRQILTGRVRMRLLNDPTLHEDLRVLHQRRSQQSIHHQRSQTVVLPPGLSKRKKRSSSTSTAFCHDSTDTQAMRQRTTTYSIFRGATFEECKLPTATSLKRGVPDDHTSRHRIDEKYARETIIPALISIFDTSYLPSPSVVNHWLELHDDLETHKLTASEMLGDHSKCAADGLTCGMTGGMSIFDIDRWSIKIKIARRCLDDHDHFIAVLAHELMHVVLYTMKRQLRLDGELEEGLCELAATVCLARHKHISGSASRVNPLQIRHIAECLQGRCSQAQEALAAQPGTASSKIFSRTESLNRVYQCGFASAYYAFTERADCKTIFDTVQYIGRNGAIGCGCQDRARKGWHCAVPK